MNDSDADLRIRFAALRSHHQSMTPRLEAILARAPRRAVNWRPALAAAVTALLALVVGGAWHALRPLALDPAELAMPAWPRSTDSLLPSLVSLRAGVDRLPSDAFRRTPSLSEQEQR